MAFLQPNELKETARLRLDQATADPRRLVLLHTGAIVLLNLAVNGLNMYLNQQIGSTGGLGGLGTRSILQTIKTLLYYVSLFFTPFWTAGLLHCMISIIRRQETGTKSLFYGFRRFGRIMSYQLWQMILLVLLCVVLMYAVCFVFLLTPFAKDFMKLSEPLMMDPNLFLADGTMNFSILPIEELTAALIPFFIMYAAVIAPVYALFSYHLRLTNFLLIEGAERGAFASMIVSIRMMKGHKKQILKLDLCFWWYYLLEGLLLGVLYLDLILPLLGIVLPLNPTVFYFVTIILYSILELGLHYWKKAEIDATYALAYETIFRKFVPGTPS